MGDSLKFLGLQHRHEQIDEQQNGDHAGYEIFHNDSYSFSQKHAYQPPTMKRTVTTPMKMRSLCMEANCIQLRICGN
jgi:hypothetical protein